MNKHRIEHCPIRRNVIIRNLLIHAFAARDLSQKAVVEEARKNFGISLTEEVLSSYLNSFDPFDGTPIKGRKLPSLENLLWLCSRYGVEVSLGAKMLSFSEQELRQRARDFNPETFIRKKR